jgi:hypothetical protein
MPIANRSLNFPEFRKKYPYFIYDNYFFRLDQDGLTASWEFDLAGEYRFRPSLFIPRKFCFLRDEEILPHLSNIVFHIGLIELISYWKTACPPRLIIRPHGLGIGALEWWRTLYFHGLGEFFYLNGIETSMEEFMTIETDGKPILPPTEYPVSDDVLIPVGGGKDSAVTLELLHTLPGCLPMSVNPNRASLEIIRAGGCNEDTIIGVNRTLDPLLFELNAKGFLNGHTPFSALIAFVSFLTALLSGRRYIALSNESSASEATIPGTQINHQYSKSLEFETGFRTYMHCYITPSVEYFSFLRPLHELQIAQLFSRFKQYHPLFRSCNAGSKAGVWCGTCAKCLFTTLILAPFLKPERLIAVFGKDLLADPTLIPLLDQLTGIAAEKPFDCVGTIHEVNIALCDIIRRWQEPELPVLLQHYLDSPAYTSYSREDIDSFLRKISPRHHVPGRFFSVLKRSMHE